MEEEDGGSTMEEDGGGNNIGSAAPVTPARGSIPKKVAKDLVPLQYDPNIFWFHKENVEQPVVLDTMKTNLQRCKQKLLDALNYCGSLKHQAYMIHKVLTEGEQAPIGLALGIFEHPGLEPRVAQMTLDSIKAMLNSGYVLRSNTNQAITSQTTLFKFIAPAAPPDDCSEETEREHKCKIREQAKILGLTETARKRHLEMSFVRRDILAGKYEKVLLVQMYKRRSLCIVNDENKSIVKIWALYQCKIVVESPNQKDTRNVYDPETGEKTGVERVYVYEEGQRSLFEEFKLPADEGGCALAYDASGELQIHRTTFEKLLPVNLKRMNKTHKAMCCCSTCQNCEWKVKAAVEHRKRVSEHFEVLLTTKYPVGHPARTKVMANRDKYNTEAFPDGKPLWDNKNDAYHSICCPSVNPNRDWWVPYKCQLGFCEKCPKLKLMPGETIKNSPNEIHNVTYKVNAPIYTCPNHGEIGTQSKCIGCEHDGVPVKKRPKLKSKASVVYKQAVVGDFFGKLLPNELRIYSKHRFQKNELSIIGMIGQRMKHGFDNPGNVMFRRDYTSRFPMEYNNLSMSVGMSGFPLVGMEGMCTWYKLPGKEERVLEWTGVITDEKQQDSRTSLDNSLTVTPRFKDMGLLRRNTEDVCMDISDGCVKQYKCANAYQGDIWRCWETETAINSMQSCAMHGKNQSDSLAGNDKSHCGQKLVRGWDSATYANGKPVNQATIVYNCLSDPARRYGAKNDTKHKRKEGEEHVRENVYYLKIYNETHQIPFKSANFHIPPEQFGTGKKKGIHEMFLRYCHNDMPGNTLALRRMPCFCPPCRYQLGLPWDIHKSIEDQPKFVVRDDCELGGSDGRIPQLGVRYTGTRQCPVQSS